MPRRRRKMSLKKGAAGLGITLSGGPAAAAAKRTRCVYFRTKPRSASGVMTRKEKDSVRKNCTSVEVWLW